MNNVLKSGFSAFLNEQDLRSAIGSVCAEFGKVTYLEMLPVTRVTPRQCLCFLRLDSASAEDELRRKLHINRFADDLYFFADVDDNWTRSVM
jgi:hypothetical protein